jgi:transcriptional regulator of heat shock response
MAMAAMNLLVAGVNKMTPRDIDKIQTILEMMEEQRILEQLLDSDVPTSYFANRIAMFVDDVRALDTGEIDATCAD